jgi:phosphoglucosamine mutase
VLLNIRTDKKVNLADLEGVKTAVAAVENKLGNKGRVLLRTSGTEPLVRVMVEGVDLAEVNKYANQLVEEVKKSITA